MYEKKIINWLIIGLNIFNICFAAQRTVICETIYSET